MTNILETVSYDNPVFRAYIFWSSILILKMLAMAYLTGKQRRKKMVLSNPEDNFIFDDKNVKPVFDDPDVERVRRAHLNDLENILPFLTAGFFFVLTNPSEIIGVNLFRFAAIARIAHTYFYAIAPRQPARGISWFVCYLITAIMCVKSAWYFC